MGIILGIKHKNHLSKYMGVMIDQQHNKDDIYQQIKTKLS